jgi:hypothetical protein
MSENFFYSPLWSLLNYTKQSLKKDSWHVELGVIIHPHKKKAELKINNSYTHQKTEIRGHTAPPLWRKSPLTSSRMRGKVIMVKLARVHWPHVKLFCQGQPGKLGEVKYEIPGPSGQPKEEKKLRSRSAHSIKD